MGLQGDAAIVGMAEFKHQRKFKGPRKFTIEQWAELTRLALDDAGLAARDLNGICCTAIRETEMLAPATLVEYLGIPVNYAEYLDLGGASSVGMVWRAAAAIELGMADAVICAVPGRPIPSNPNPGPPNPRRYFGGSSHLWGSPQAEFDIPYGNVAQNCGYAMIAQRYAHEHGYDAYALAKLVSDQRASGALNPQAAFYQRPIEPSDVLASKLIADPLRLLEIVMPVAGGGAVIVASRESARRCRHRRVWIKGCGEHLTHKTLTYAPNIGQTPVGPAASEAFDMAGLEHADIDACQIYDCYSITVLTSIEDSGFCPKGAGMKFVRDHDLTFRGDFPVNTHGGQLSMGQSGIAGGMTQVVEAATQIMARAGDRQVKNCNRVFVTGTGGIMSEQSALIMEGD